MAGDSEYLHSVLGRTGMPVFRLGLSASYRPGVETVHRALDEGINFFFAYGFDRHDGPGPQGADENGAGEASYWQPARTITSSRIRI